MRRRTQRRGATLLESALTLPVFVLLVMGTMDVGMGVFRLHTISSAARSGARLAIVHGSMAPPADDAWTGPWGPEPIDVALTDGGVPIAAAVGPLLVGSNPAESHVMVEWPDGGNAPGQRVNVTVTSPYRPIVTFIFGNPGLTIRSTSAMTIAH